MTRSRLDPVYCLDLMHDEFKTSVEAAFRIIDNLTAKGYTFVTVDELMVD